MMVIARLDEVLRDLAATRLREFAPQLGQALIGDAIDSVLGNVEPSAVLRQPTAEERTALMEALAKLYGERLAVEVLPDDATELVRDLARRLVSTGVLRDRPGLLSPRPGRLQRAAEVAGEVLGFARPTLSARVAEHLAAAHQRRLRERTK